MYLAILNGRDVLGEYPKIEEAKLACEEDYQDRKEFDASAYYDIYQAMKAVTTHRETLAWQDSMPF